MINKLVFSWGEVECPMDKIPKCRMLKSGRPDLRFKEGRAWWFWFKKCEIEGRLV